MGGNHHLAVILRQPAQDQFQGHGFKSLLRKPCQEQIGLIRILAALQPGIADIFIYGHVRHPAVAALLL